MTAPVDAPPSVPPEAPALHLEPPDGPAAATLLLAHGAGAPMDSAAMTALAAALRAEGLAVARFEFPYMAARRTGPSRSPAPKAETLVPVTRAALAALLATTEGPVLLAGKSMGGRIAVLAAGAPLDPRVTGVVVFGYPFHPTGRPETLRFAPLRESRLPVLVAQGTRDPFGTRAEVESYGPLGPVTLHWTEDGDHDLRPRKASGTTAEDARAAVARRVRKFVGERQ